MFIQFYYAVIVHLFVKTLLFMITMFNIPINKITRRSLLSRNKYVLVLNINITSSLRNYQYISTK